MGDTAEDVELIFLKNQRPIYLLKLLGKLLVGITPLLVFADADTMMSIHGSNCQLPGKIP